MGSIELLFLQNLRAIREALFMHTEELVVQYYTAGFHKRPLGFDLQVVRGRQENYFSLHTMTGKLISFVTWALETQLCPYYHRRRFPERCDTGISTNKCCEAKPECVVCELKLRTDIRTISVT